jgi:hypothetical protein
MFNPNKLNKDTHNRLSEQLTTDIVYMLEKGYTTASIVEAFDDPLVDGNRVAYLKRTRTNKTVKNNKQGATDDKSN